MDAFSRFCEAAGWTPVAFDVAAPVLADASGKRLPAAVDFSDPESVLVTLPGGGPSARFPRREWSACRESLSRRFRGEYLGVPSEELAKVLVRGTLFPHPAFVRSAVPGGSAHIRAVDLSLGRPFLFRRYDDVRFPLSFELTGNDVVAKAGFGRAFRVPFYVECFYVGPGAELYGSRAGALGAEAWGRSGKPCPLSAGAQVRLVLNSIWTPELYHGDFRPMPGDFFSCWLDAPPEVREQGPGTLTVTAMRYDPFAEREVETASRTVRADPRDFPILCGLSRDDLTPDGAARFPDSNTGTGLRGHLVVRFRADNGKSFTGGRASRGVQIDLDNVNNPGLKVTAFRPE